MRDLAVNFGKPARTALTIAASPAALACKNPPGGGVTITPANF
jgi:hypothetical protein